MDQAARGKKALEASRYEEAIAEYTAALKVSPTSPDYLTQRSIALLRASRPEEALKDANDAVIYAQKRAKREHIIEAQFRRGCVLYKLNRYGDARFVFEVVERMDQKSEKEKHHKTNATWLAKVNMTIKSLAEDDEKLKVTVTETPNLDERDQSGGNAGVHSVTDNTASNAAVIYAAPPSTAVEQAPGTKVRHDWYQNNQSVYFTLLVKGVPKDVLQVDIQERSVNISYPLVSGSTYDHSLDPLFAPVQPEKCTVRVLPTRIEVVLVKATPGVKWSALESAEPLSTEPKTDIGSKADAEIERAVFSSPSNSKPAGPAYPTSSKSGPKDWDKVAATSLNEARDPSAKPGSVEDDDDYEGGDEANHFFKKLFKGATPEAQRAMMKSYTESNGTALSTNWEEVKKGPVETLPPDGMEAKKWTG